MKTFLQTSIRALSVLLGLFVLIEVNYPRLTPQSQLAIFAMLGLCLCYLLKPVRPRWSKSTVARAIDLLLCASTVVVCGYIVVQNEPLFESWWLSSQSLGDRAGAELPVDFAIGIAGLLLVLEAARRMVGWALPALSLLFVAYALWGPHMPGWLFPHRGYGVERIVAQTFLHSQGVFGIALKVMLTYVFLFVVFGAFLEITGATRWILNAARRLFGDSAGGPAKVSVLSSGLMGSLSGSAVANTATTGTFTIPLMRSSGFKPHVAAGIEAAASSGGALVPPIMGAGAYMMLEIVEPQVTYLQIIQAALLPAVLYYLSLFLIVHFSAGKLEEERETARKAPSQPPFPKAGSSAAEAADVRAEASRADDPQADGAPEKEAFAGSPEVGPFAGVIFVSGLVTLIGILLAGWTVFRAVTVALGLIVVLSWFHPASRVTPRRALDAMVRAARGGIALVAAAASVGVILGVVTLTGIGSKLPATIIPLAQDNLFLALLLVMVSSIVLGMGLPSAVCYLLLATLIGPALGKLGVVPLAAHLFIFYFGLMSMVTPPVALAAYTAASIAGSGIMRTGFAAFRYALVGFALPFVFVYRPQLLMLDPATGEMASSLEIFAATAIVGLGVVPLAAGIAGYFGRPLGWSTRGLFLVAAALLFVPEHTGGWPAGPWNLVGAVVFGVGWATSRQRGAEQGGG